MQNGKMNMSTFFALIVSNNLYKNKIPTGQMSDSYFVTSTVSAVVRVIAQTQYTSHYMQYACT